jgi:hypothetical protein
MSIVEAGDDRFALTVDELTASFEEDAVVVGADPDYFTIFDCHQLRPGPAAVHSQHISVIENQVCCFCAQILLLDP